jgi:ankyrin repeat protein/Tfp pilus assembly protein PilF
MVHPNDALFAGLKSLELVRAALVAGADPNAKDEDGDVPLVLVEPRSPVFDLLLEAGANINATDGHSHSVFMLEAGGGRLDHLPVLLDRGADPSLADGRGYTALHFAAQEGHLEVVTFLVRKVGLSANLRTEEGATALLIASGKGYLDMMKVLVESGADAQMATEAGWTPLMLASRGGHLDAVGFLLDCGCELDVRDSSGWTALMSAVVSGKREVVALLLDRGAQADLRENDGWGPLRFALDQASLDRDEKLELVELVLAAGSSLDLDEELCLAVLRGEIEAVRDALTRGANVESCYLGRGASPLELCAMHAELPNRAEIARILVDADASAEAVELCDIPLDCPELVKLLIRAGAEVDGDALVAAASSPEPDQIVPILLEAGVEPITEYWSALGNRYFEERRFEKALDAFLQITDDDRNSAFWSNVGYCHQNTGQHEQAIAAFETAIEMNPSKAHTCVAVCFSAYSLERWEVMLSYAQKAVALTPSNDYAWQQLAIASEKLGDSSGAEAANRKACELNEKNAYARINLAAIVWKARKELLATELTQAFALAPELRQHLDEPEFADLKAAFENAAG